ncbi:hypothetical protein VTP01DRAFT_1456 [Rhizomucor pusillus]|uniref:uncharacterized protein n=1 Tax=Rhizomucor pusillus TaxID=4840 RepID=UPI0037429FCC
MGLAENKIKQRLSADPNNLAWSNDQSKFGFRMLMKMGWAPGKGLGVNEDGGQHHIKIKLKDDNLGLGAKKNQSDNWLGNTDAFSQLLANLNSQPQQPAAEEEEKEKEDKKDKKSSKKDKKDKKKRKKQEDDEEQEELCDRKKRKLKQDSEEKSTKKEKKEKKKDKKSKKSKKSKKESSGSSSSSSENEESKASETSKAAATLRNAARAKFLRAKRMATQHDQKMLNEILGVRSS